MACSMQFGFSSLSVSFSAMLGGSKNGGKYGQRRSTLNNGCITRNDGMLSLKALSPMALVMVYGPYRGEQILQWGPARRSFCKCSQTLSPTWNLCDTRC